MRQLSEVYHKRKLPPKYDGIICTFDLDKTYLATKFEKLSGLVKIPFEKPEEKQNIPGAAAVVRELRRGVKKDSPPTPIFFISASPQMLEKVIRQKLELDGVSIDGILFRDFRSAIKKLQFKKLIDKIGYKLAALLYARTTFPPKARELLFGDDSEYDALIYSLYSDIVAGRLDDYEVLTILKKWQVAEDERNMIRDILHMLEESPFRKREVVERIFIHLEMKTPPAMHTQLSRLVVPTQNYYQTAVLLYSGGYITRAGLFRVISELIRTYKFTVPVFTASTEDLLKRNLIDPDEAKRLLKIIAKNNPLFLPRRILTELWSEFQRIFTTISPIPDSFSHPMRRKEDKHMSLVERYLRVVPQRNV
ncbi:MAG: hypothetical protein NZM25_09605 [Leptospiraceae bacterium]|nr:hypothetical protein [Leptospiraceae bacterium]MDW8306413.1 DUF2183 domain-containing protein [Leptospiraceae bacterium]